MAMRPFSIWLWYELKIWSDFIKSLYPVQRHIYFKKIERKDVYILNCSIKQNENVKHNFLIIYLPFKMSKSFSKRDNLALRKISMGYCIPLANHSKWVWFCIVKKGVITRRDDGILSSLCLFILNRRKSKNMLLTLYQTRTYIALKVHIAT